MITVAKNNKNKNISHKSVSYAYIAPSKNNNSNNNPSHQPNTIVHGYTAHDIERCFMTQSILNYNELLNLPRPFFIIFKNFFEEVKDNTELVLYTYFASKTIWHDMKCCSYKPRSPQLPHLIIFIIYNYD